MASLIHDTSPALYYDIVGNKAIIRACIIDSELPEGSGAKFEVYLGIATAATVLRAELEDIQTQLRHQHSLRVSVEFLAAHWR